MSAKTTRIHVNRQNIARNRKGENLPVITAKDYTQNRKGSEAIIYGPTGEEVARVVYRPEHPLSCGAVLWIETKERVEVLP